MRKRLKKKRSLRQATCQEVLPSLSFLQRIFLERLEEAVLISTSPRFNKPDPIGQLLRSRGLSDLPPGTRLITQPLPIMQPSPEKVDAMFESLYNSLRAPR